MRRRDWQGPWITNGHARRVGSALSSPEEPKDRAFVLQGDVINRDVVATKITREDKEDRSESRLPGRSPYYRG